MPKHSPNQTLGPSLPALIDSMVGANPGGSPQNPKQILLDFFFGELENDNTRKAYGQALQDFVAWIKNEGLTLHSVCPYHVGLYLQSLPLAPASKQLRLSALRRFFSTLVTRGLLAHNPAASVKAPRQKARVGKTKALEKQQVQALWAAIDKDSLLGARDLAIIATMLYGFCRVSAACRLKISDFHKKGPKAWLRLHEKGGLYHEIPCHPKLTEALGHYLELAGLTGANKNTPLFRSARPGGQALSETPLSRIDIYRMVKKRLQKAGIFSEGLCNHSFRATAITNFLLNQGQLDTAQRLAGHADPRTTKLYDRRFDHIAAAEVERLQF